MVNSNKKGAGINRKEGELVRTWDLVWNFSAKRVFVWRRVELSESV